jgi:rod shape-determining protein MreC
LLITDPDHAVPVVVARNGVRLVAYGKGRSDRLELANIPLSSDVKVGDSIVTSGLGGRFPAGFPVGTVMSLQPDDSRAFLVGQLKPAAQLDRGRDVLLLKSRASGIGNREPTRPAAPSVAAPSAAPMAPLPTPTPKPASRPSDSRLANPSSGKAPQEPKQ